MLINIGNAADLVIPLSEVRDVHPGKMILDVEALGPDLKGALRHVPDAEDPQYAASSVEVLLPDIELPPDGPLKG